MNDTGVMKKPYPKPKPKPKTSEDFEIVELEYLDLKNRDVNVFLRNSDIYVSGHVRSVDSNLNLMLEKVHVKSLSTQQVIENVEVLFLDGKDVQSISF